MLYILLAGGLFNAVLVPQLVRAQHHPDGGEAFVNRIVTLAALFLTGVTIVLIVGAPMLMQVFLSGLFNQPEMAAQRQSVIDFARYCLPQVFFYGMFVLMGQILNARGTFGPMMWRSTWWPSDQPPMARQAHSRRPKRWSWAWGRPRAL